MKIVILWTDVLLWSLMVCMCVYASRVRCNPLTNATWGHVFQSKVAAVSAVILSMALVVTLLDSIHYRPLLENTSGKKNAVAYSPNVKSALDVVLEPLHKSQEKSYSAPLATYGLSKETIQKNGMTTRDYPRLKFAGKHLKNPDDVSKDQLWRAFRGAVLGGLLFALLALCWVSVIRHQQQTTVKKGVSASSKAGMITLGMLCVLGGVAWQLGLGYHVLGTDKVGLDVLYISLKSIRTAMVLGLLTTLVTLPSGILAGLAAGYFRGWVDVVIQYIYTTLNSIPSVLLIAAAVLMLQVGIDANPDAFPTSLERADIRLFFLCMILCVNSWTGLARLLRGEVFKLRELEYVQAAQSFGASNWRILMNHLLPNVMHLVLIALVMDFSGLVLAEAVLSYVGVGVDPSTLSFGTMINAARLELSREPIVWWTLAAAFVFMLVLVLAANLFADAVRDAFDPRARQLKQSLVRV